MSEGGIKAPHEKVYTGPRTNMNTHRRQMAYLRKLGRRQKDRHDWASYSVLCTRLHLIRRENFIASTESRRRSNRRTASWCVE
jgi:hypothetical protein